MRIQEICITSLTLVAFVCLLGQNGLALNQNTKQHQRFIRADEILESDTILDVSSVRSEHNLHDTLIGNTTKYIKDIEIKPSENKKKILGLIDGAVGLSKLKNETKYHRPKDSKMEEKTMKLSGLFVTEPTTLPTSTSDQVNKNIHHLSDFSLNSQPILNSSLINVEKISTQFETRESNFSRARALNISTPEPTNSLNANLTDLSDVSMDDEDKEVEGGEYIANHNDTYTEITPVILLSEHKCMENNKTYAVGDKIIRNCNEKCVCGQNGTIQNCEPLCIPPYVRASKGTQDPFCHEQKVSEDGCCAVVVCADSAPEPDETCFFANKPILRGQRVEDGCTKTCFCDIGGVLKCEPRCPPNETTSEIHNHDRCVALADPRDPCCTITYCDVSLGEHEIKSENVADLSVSLTDVKVLNSTAVKLKLSSELTNKTVIEISKNNHIWSQQNPDKGGILLNLEPAHSYYIRITEEGRTGPAIRVTLPAEVIKTNITEKMDKNSCSHRGKLYKIGAEWYDECISFCVCNEGAKTECITIECPTDFGLDVLDPHCLDWETVPPNFVAKAPHCCPQEVRCRNNGSCDYEGKTYDNWSEIPSNVTGCEKRCYCDMGKVSCQAACPPVLALPPASLQCSNRAILAKLPHDECCSHWICDPTGSSSSGKNTSFASLGPMTIDLKNQQSIDNSEKPSNKSKILSKPIQEVGSSGSSHLWYNQNMVSTSNAPELLHYPMDPGHPTIPYNGPYNPDYKPTEASVEEIFQLSNKQHEKIAPPLKDKSKSKTDSKKLIEPIKQHKEIIEQHLLHHHQPIQENFPGPLAPDKFPLINSGNNKKNTENFNIPTKNLNKLSSPPIKEVNTADQPQFISLNNPDSASFSFSPINGENIPPAKFDPTQFDNSAAGPPYRDIESTSVKQNTQDPLYNIPTNTKKKTPGGIFSDELKPKPDYPSSTKIKSSQKMPDQGILPEEILHLINLHHPGIAQPENHPIESHPGLYEFHQQISNQGDSPTNQIPLGYFGVPIQGSKKVKPQIVAHKNEDGETTYHIHTQEIPNSNQQIEELLAHINQYNTNLGSLQNYPHQNPLIHPYQNGLPAQPPRIDAHTPNSGVLHLNHPFNAQAPMQSGLSEDTYTTNFPIHSGISTYSHNVPGQPLTNEVFIKALDALDEKTVRLIFTVPSILVGLHGRVELRYTSDKANMDPSTWESQVFIPPNDIIATPQLEFELDGLEPATEYKVRVIVNLRDIKTSPSSKIYSVRTLNKHEELTTLPPQIPIDAELRVMEINSSWINVIWKKFTEYELQFIDGVQLRYKEHDSKVYATTSLIHRAVTNYFIENLKPSTTYEIGISIIPFPGQTTELISERTIQITTSVEPDPYSFDVKVEIKMVKSQDVEISWSGVPYPEDKYVNIYRAIYQSDSGKGDTSTFKIAKRDSPAKTIINDLKPGTRYRLWLEVYLTNGRIKKSNVQDFITKPGTVLPVGISQQGKLASIPLHEGNYYGPLVIVAIVASLAILSTLILLMMLMKRRSSSKADISPRKTTSAYDNPSYKVEIQQETMDL
ncbi:putative epidermal cell surface receptor isoform X2 [Chelonus insularis]|uniref:putative epidermal cell surface receptor isoform X2 n=1 Tax=Chelonus insularis TaxID=460826 RepID=UPI00158D1210|nr:putative epidermal cell surface receptor isoform X2 [Chelonus insularis]